RGTARVRSLRTLLATGNLTRWYWVPRRTRSLLASYQVHTKIISKYSLSRFGEIRRMDSVLSQSESRHRRLTAIRARDRCPAASLSRVVKSSASLRRSVTRSTSIGTPHAGRLYGGDISWGKSSLHSKWKRDGESPSRLVSYREIY